MSRIKDLTTKTKISLDEMFESNTEASVVLDEKLDNQLDGNPKKQKTRQQSKPPTIQIENLTNSNQETHFQKDVGGGLQATGLAQKPSQIHIPKPALDGSVLQEEQQWQESSSIHSTLRYSPTPIQTFKMTFNLTEFFYKAFNDIYAKRMLQGRKTEKSELICQAIALLVKAEEEADRLN